MTTNPHTTDSLPPTAETPIPSGPVGLGGWLLLPLIGLFFMSGHILWLFYRDYAPFFNPVVWTVISDPNFPSYHPLLVPFIVFELVGYALLFGFGLWVLYLFFSRARRLPRHYIVWLLCALVFQGIDVALSAQIPALQESNGAIKLWLDIAGSVIEAAIWIPYFLKSKRVKNTFVQPVTAA